MSLLHIILACEVSKSNWPVTYRTNKADNVLPTGLLLRALLQHCWFVTQLVCTPLLAVSFLHHCLLCPSYITACCVLPTPLFIVSLFAVSFLHHCLLCHCLLYPSYTTVCCILPTPLFAVSFLHHCLRCPSYITVCCILPTRLFAVSLHPAIPSSQSDPISHQCQLYLKSVIT